MTRRLEKAGFEIERLRYGNVDNFWATRGKAAPCSASRDTPTSFRPVRSKNGNPTPSARRA